MKVILGKAKFESEDIVRVTKSDGVVEVAAKCSSGKATAYIRFEPSNDKDAYNAVWVGATSSPTQEPSDSNADR